MDEIPANMPAVPPGQATLMEVHDAKEARRLRELLGKVA
jgi:hypothetical protein